MGQSAVKNNERHLKGVSFLTNGTFSFTQGLAQVQDPMFFSSYTAKTKYRNFEINIPRKGISGPQSQFPHSYVCERFIYSTISVSLFCWRNYVDRSWDYINRSQTHECWNWGWGRAIPRKEINKGDFLCSVGETAKVKGSRGQLIKFNFPILPWQFGERAFQIITPIHWETSLRGIELFFSIPNILSRAGIFKKSMGARHRVGIGLLYRPARLHRLAEFIPWNRFRGPIHVQKYQLCLPPTLYYIILHLGWYSEAGFHIGMGRNFVCLWHRHNCNWSLPFCAHLLIYKINYWVFKQF